MNDVIRDNKLIIKRIRPINKDLPGVQKFDEINVALSTKEYYISGKKIENDKYTFDYFDNIPFELNKTNVKLIANYVSDLHLTKSDNFSNFDVLNLYKKYKEVVKLPDNIVDIEKRILLKIENDIDNQEKSFCHNDLNPTNILSDGNEVKIIDFDFAGINYKIFDIVRFFSQNDLNLELRRIFLI